MTSNASKKWHRYLRFWHRNVGADVDEEIAFHVDTRTQELIDEGASTSAARAQALREFGDVERARGVLRAMDEQHVAREHRVAVFTDLWQDVRLAARSLTGTPGFVLTVTLTLALGIGLNSAVYSIVDAYLLRPMPVANGKDLVVLAQTDAAFAQPHETSFPNYKDFASDTSIFRGLAAYVVGSMNMSGGRGAERIYTEEATANFFEVLGVKPYLGRLFLPGEDQGELAHPYIVLSYSFWRSHFGGNAAVIGDTIRLNNHPITIIGVTPPEFHGKDPLLDIQAFTLINQTWPSFGKSLTNRGSSELNVFGLLRRGMSLESAREAVQAKARTLEGLYPEANRNVQFVLQAETRTRPNIAVSSNVPAIAAAFMVLVMLVLAIACANVTSLLLARAAARYKEQAIRVALGANQWRLVRRIAVECFLLAGLGGVGAVALALVAVRALSSVRVAADVPIRWTISVDTRVLGFTLAIVAVTALLASIAPALALRRTNLTDVLKSGARGSGGRMHQRVRTLLVVTQLAVSVVIVVCAALFARSASNASRINPGYRTDHILMATATLGIQGYDSIRGKQFERDVVRRVAQLPGVRSVALSRHTPLGYNNDIEYVIPEISLVKLPENGVGCFNNIVTPEYFATMGIPILEGRAFTAGDDESAPKVAVITSAFAKRLWPGSSAIGKRFRVGKDGPWQTVVGVSGDIQYFSLGETPKPFFFRPYSQNYRSAFTLNVLTANEPGTLTNELRGVLASLDPGLPIFDVRGIREHIANGRAMLGTRIGAMFAAVFAALALILASVGVYGLIAYSVAQRTREIGIRVALGARMTSVVGLVVRQGLVIALVGIGVGLGMALIVARLLSNLLYGVAPHDPVILAGVAAALAVVGAGASLIPARRATRIDPLNALRIE